MKSTILAEDKDILVCYKPPGIAARAPGWENRIWSVNSKIIWEGKILISVWCTDWISLFQETLFLPKRRLRQQP